MFTLLNALLIATALLVTVPLALRALKAQQATAWAGGAAAAARWSAAASLFAPRGTVAWLLVGPWLVVSVALVWHHRRAPLAHLVVLAWLPAAAVWLLADRLGVRPFGFAPHLVTLTAAHFHHAGFGISALLAAVGARRGLVVHQVGMVLVAAGLTAAHATGLGFDGATLPGSRLLEPIGATCIVAALVVWGRHAWRCRAIATGWRRAAFAISAVAWTYPMTLALGWALTPLGPSAVIGPLTRSLTAMVAQHGAVNAIAVVLLGLAALAGAAVPPASRRDRRPDALMLTHQGEH